MAQGGRQYIPLSGSKAKPVTSKRLRKPGRPSLAGSGTPKSPLRLQVLLSSGPDDYPRYTTGPSAGFPMGCSQSANGALHSSGNSSCQTHPRWGWVERPSCPSRATADHAPKHQPPSSATTPEPRGPTRPIFLPSDPCHSFTLRVRKEEDGTRRVSTHRAYGAES